MPYVGVGAQRDVAKNLTGKPMMKVYVLIFFCFLLTMAVALLGKHHKDHPSKHMKIETVNDVHRTISRSLMENIQAENIKENLRKLTKEPHIAGSDANKRVAYKIAEMWSNAGLEDVHTVPYEVLLSYPDFENTNKVIIKDSYGQEIFKSKGVSPVLNPKEQDAKYAGHQWVAWAGNGTVSGDVVYVNRGTSDDFKNLEKMDVHLKGNIALMRYGGGFRGDKVHEAQSHGAIGVILFSDPEDVAADGIDNSHVYPKSIWMPSEGVQRGTIMHGDGDPLSPLYPSKKELFNSRTIKKAKSDGVLPSIPALPVSYSTALQILQRMKGRAAPLHWQGGVNVTYRVGPGFVQGQKTTIEVHSSLQTKRIRNVVGYIRGADEPDRYVILGNHFDAWVYGSIDPNSGTAILAEVVRAMMQSVNETSWRPARTIMFTAWDAEEYGLLGSTEFVEEFVDILRQRAVVYLNMDCLQGNSTLSVHTIPSLFNTIVAVAKKVRNPLKSERDLGRETMFDTWNKMAPSSRPEMPKMGVPSGGSDHASFLNFAGVPVVDFNYKNETTKDTYPLYHTLYETPFTNEHLMDTDNFAIHRGVGQFWAELARVFTDEAVLPFNSTQLAVSLLKEYIPQVRTALSPLSYYKTDIEPAKTQLAAMTKTAQNFFHMSRLFEKTVLFTRNSFSQNPYDSRQISSVNERIMNLERCFINPRGLPGSPQSRHVLFSVSSTDSYAATVMAGVHAAIDKFNSGASTERTELGRQIAIQISNVHYSIICALNTLRDVI